MCPGGLKFNPKLYQHPSMPRRPTYAISLSSGFGTRLTLASRDRLELGGSSPER